MGFKNIAAVLVASVSLSSAEPAKAELENLLAAGELALLVEYARGGGDILPVLKHYAEKEPPSLPELARIYHARSQFVASFSEGQAEALLTIACLLQRESGPVAGLETAEVELDKKLGRFKTSGTPLIQRGEGWSFEDGETFADDAWAGSDFDDTFWSVENAPLGHGAEGLATETKPAATLYLRRYFDVEDPTRFYTLRAALSGTAEIRGIFVNGKAREFDALTPEDLVKGSNVFAVAVAAPAAGGLSFDLKLTANLPSAAHHLATIDESALGSAIGKYWAALPADLRKQLVAAPAE